MTTVRDTMRGIKSNPTRLPATVSRTASLAKVAQNIHGKLRYARFTPQALVGSLILGEILDRLIEQGYTYDAASGTMIKPGDYVCVGNTKYDDCFQDPYAIIVKLGASLDTPEKINNTVDQLCRQYYTERYDGPLRNLSHISNSSLTACMGYNHVPNVIAVIRRSQNVRLTDSDLQRILEPIAAQNPEAVLQAADLSDSDWSAPKVHVLPGTIVNSQPFTDLSDGKAKQARWEFYDCEDGQSCVRETLIDRPDLQPNSPAAPAPDNPPANGNDTAPGNGDSAGNNTGSGNQSGSEGEQDKDDLCRKYPHIMACDEQPEPGSYDLSIPHETVNLSFHPDNVFSTDAACPAGATFDVFGQTATISLAPACDAARSIRPMLIALAWLAAAFFVIRTVRAAV